MLEAKRGNVRKKNLTGRHRLSSDSHNTSLPGVGALSFRIHENVDRDCGFKGKPKSPFIMKYNV